MGVWVGEDWSLVLRPFRDTATARNLAQMPEAVINITNDSALFFRTAFKDEVSAKEELPFEASQTVEVPRLHGMLAYLEVGVEPRQSPKAAKEPKSEVDVLEYECSVHSIDAPNQPPVVYSRARCAAIEAVIHATRIRALHASDPAKSKQLLAQIQECRALVQRVAPASPHARVVEDTLRLVHRWMKA